MSMLAPKESVTLGAATAALVFGVYTYSLPNMSTVRATLPHDDSVESGRKRAVWTAAAVVGGLAVLTKDPTVFTLGGAMLLLLDWHARHANMVHPETGKIVLPGARAFDPVESRVPEAAQGGESTIAPAGSTFAFG